MTHPSPPPHVPRVTFHVTDRCAYNCRFCFVPPVRRVDELTGEPWSTFAVALAARWPGVELVFTGGEPLLFPGVFDVLAAATTVGAWVDFNATGFGLGPHEATLLGEVGVRCVNLSLDGPPELHNRLRGHPDAFRFAMEALDNIAGNAPGVRRNIVAVVMGANVDLLPDLIRTWDEDARIDGIYLQVATNPEGPDGSGRWLADDDLWPADPTRVTRTFDRLLAGARTTKLLNPPAALAMQARFLTDPHFRLNQPCRVGEFGFCVDARGDVSLCGRFAPVGNIVRDDPAAILASPAWRETRARMLVCEFGCHRQINCASADQRDYLV